MYVPISIVIILIAYLVLSQYYVIFHAMYAIFVIIRNEYLQLKYFLDTVVLLLIFY